MKTTEGHWRRITEEVWAREGKTYECEYSSFIKRRGLTEDFQLDCAICADYPGYLSFKIDFVPDFEGRSFARIRFTKFPRRAVEARTAEMWFGRGSHSTPKA